MSFYYPTGNSSLEPNQGNIRSWLDNLYSKFQPLEQSRWNEANIDTLFYAGQQQYVNRYFGSNPGFSYQNFSFNVIAQPINMVTGFQRQHRKSISYVPSENADSSTTDQYTRLITHVNNVEGINEQFSRGCEQAAIAGMVLAQPYLDFTSDDPAQGSLKLKIWEYNSFIVDPYFRAPDMSDANFVWCQEYINKQEALARFPDHAKNVVPMQGSPQQLGRFYFLPENYNMARNDLMVLSYVWYRCKRKRKKLYSASRHQFFDFSQGHSQIEQVLYQIPDLKMVEVEVSTWKLCVVLNDQLIYQDFNPMGHDLCPVVPIYWNYDPHCNQADSRVRSLIRPMRSSQYLLGRRILLNHDISESSINSGWIRKSGAVANEDNLKKSGQGWDVIVNDGYELSDVQKIIPNAVPPSDMELASQLQELIFSTSGVNLENWAGQDSQQISTLTMLLKQGANLMVLQKYFDQWDLAWKLIGNLELQIVLNNWNEAKVGLIIGEEPSEHFFSGIFAKYQVIVEEGLNTATQRQQEFQQTLELNQVLAAGGPIPASYIASIATLQGKKKLMEVLAEAEKQQQEIANQKMEFEHHMEDAKLKEVYSKSVENLALARERHARTESNLGLFEERLSMIANNHSIATKNKVEALSKLLETISLYGKDEVKEQEREVGALEIQEEAEIDRAKSDARRTSFANDFVSEILQSSLGPSQGGNPQSQMGNPQEQQNEQMQMMGQQQQGNPEQQLMV